MFQIISRNIYQTFRRLIGADKTEMSSGQVHMLNIFQGFRRILDHFPERLSDS